jgi:hypothetical protein
MSTDRAQWVYDLVETAEQLGYGVVSIKRNRITLRQIGKGELKVTVSSVFLSGDLLRVVLAGRPSDAVYRIP